MQEEQRQIMGAKIMVTVTDAKFGVFVWRSDNRYEKKDAIKLYVKEQAAEKYASGHPEKVVVRTLSLLLR